MVVRELAWARGGLLSLGPWRLDLARVNHGLSAGRVVDDVVVDVVVRDDVRHVLGLRV